ncbi:RHOMBOID-like protein 13 [Galdieria sulphuraria]|nr:RHOMBOID-like protein 13 [Galdieria sulphuraria]
MNSFIIERKEWLGYFYTFPVTCLVIAICIIVWLVITYKETWRWISSTLSHISLMHLILNMYSLWNLSWMEQRLGSLVYLTWNVVIAFLSTCVTLFINYLQLTVFHSEQVRHVYLVGYSAVLFGLFVIASQHIKVARIWILDEVLISPIWIPFISLGVVTLLVPEASFVGHCSGILIGFLICLDKYNDWFQLPWCWIWLLGIGWTTFITMPWTIQRNRFIRI